MLQAYCLLTLWDFTALCRQPTANPQCRPRCLLHFTSALGPTVGRLLWLYTTSKQTCILGIINGFLHKFHRKFFCFCGNSKLLCSCGFIYVWVALNLMAVQSASNTYYSPCRVEYFFSHSSPKTMNNSVILFKCHVVFRHQFFFLIKENHFMFDLKKKKKSCRRVFVLFFRNKSLVKCLDCSKGQRSTPLNSISLSKVLWFMVYSGSSWHSSESILVCLCPTQQLLFESQLFERSPSQNRLSTCFALNDNVYWGLYLFY